MVEPVFGQIKQARGFRQFLLRGVKKVRAEWAMICTTHNLLKLFTRRIALPQACYAATTRGSPLRISASLIASRLRPTQNCSLASIRIR